MEDPHSKKFLADDPGFLTSLSDLDRGMDGPLEEMAPADDEPAASPRTPISEPRLIAPPAPLDLFPATALESDPPPGPIVGTATGPRLGRGSPPHRARPTETVFPTERLPAAEPHGYETFYGLREEPFSGSTDPKFFFPSQSHERAARQVLAAIRAREGVTLLTAPRGLGKTILSRAIVREIDRRTLASVVLEPLSSADALLQAMLLDFGAIARDDLHSARNATHDGLIATLASCLESLEPLQAHAVVIVDDAHALPVEVLDEIRAMVSDSATFRLLRIVLVGEPHLVDVLKRADMRPLNERVAIRSVLEPLAADEIAGYVRHRIACAGESPRIDFDEDACAQIHEMSGGVPAIVNLLCDKALRKGYRRSASVIDAPLVAAAAAALDGQPRVAEHRGAAFAILSAVALAGLIMIGAAGALFVFRDQVARAINQWEQVPSAPGGPVLLRAVPLAPIPPPAADPR